MRDPITLSSRTLPAARPTLGDRVRQLRVSKGLTQTELAGERFSKEYVSQIERGKTRPTAETIEWLAARLGVDRGFLERGVSSGERDRVESVVARAEAILESHDYAETAEALDDKYALAQAHFQASLIADRDGRWVLARSHAERAKALYEEIAHRANVGKLLNNLGAFNFLLGKPEEAIAQLKDAFRVALEVGSETDAAYAVSSLAQVHLRTGEMELAEEQARHALELLGDREDVLDEIGNAQLVLGRSLLEQGRLDEAGEIF